MATFYGNMGEDNVIETDVNFHKKQDKANKHASIYEKGVEVDGKGIVTRDFLKKYLSYAKRTCTPEISQDCVEYAA